MARRKKKITTETIEITESPGQVEQTESEPVETMSAVSLLSEESTEPVDPPVHDPPIMESRYGVVYNARYVNVRMEPLPTAEVLRVATEGERVLILYEDNGFYKVEFIDGSSGFISSDFIKEIHGSETPEEWFVKGESILTSVKKLLGIEEECEEFDLDVMMNINAAISTLRQLGVGPNEGFMVTNKNITYSDFLGEGSKEINQVKMYLFYKTKLGFDPPSSSSVMECIKQMISEAEWRLCQQSDPKDFFGDEEGGDNSK